MKFTLLMLFITSFAIAGVKETKIALILDRGGKDDKSFNTAAFKGATEAEKKLGLKVKTIEVSDDTLFEPAIRSFAQKKYDLIIAIGFAQAEPITLMAKELPNQKFAIIDAVVNLPNVASLIFEEHEGSYLVGYAAGLKSRTGHVGFIGGMDIPLIRRFEMAYAQGAKDAKPSMKTASNYIGVTSEAWNNPTKAKELAQSQYGRESDVIFIAAGASNAGAFDAVEQANIEKPNPKKYIIGVDSNQNWIKPGLVLSSMLKRVDNAVARIIEETANGNFRAGVIVNNLKTGGIDWALDGYNRPLFSADELKKMDEVKSEIIGGKRKVLDYYIEMKKNK